MKKRFLLLSAVCCTLVAGAQSSLDPASIHLNGLPKCGFDQVLHKAHVSYSDLIRAYRHTDRSYAKETGVVYDIPVVFHIVYQQPNFNLPDSVIENQVDILNKAFRKQHADTANARPFFKPLSADAQIQFHLATIDPQGNPTTGITRTVTTHAYFGTTDLNNMMDSMERIKHTAQGGIDPWPTDQYLNIWVANLSDSNGMLSVLGYGTPPLNPLPSNWPAGAGIGLAGMVDGVVLQTHVVGSNSVLNAALQGIYTRGRAAVHEVGHYLGLQHVFGSNDGSSTSGSCGPISDDGIGDTPEQSAMSFDNNSGTSCPPATKNSCGAGTTGDLPDMWENYMDYARDACQVLFTNGQVSIMRSVLADQRRKLVNDSTTAVPVVNVGPSFSIYPNPANGSISVSLPGSVSRVSIHNFLGQQVLHLEGAAANAKTYDISRLSPGHYLVVLEADGQRAVSRLAVVR